MAPFTGGSTGSTRAPITSVNTAVRVIREASRLYRAQHRRHALGRAARPLRRCLLRGGLGCRPLRGGPGGCRLRGWRSVRLVDELRSGGVLADRFDAAQGRSLRLVVLAGGDHLAVAGVQVEVVAAAALLQYELAGHVATF